MDSTEPSQATQILDDLQGGDHSAVDRLFPVVYGELRNLAAQYLARERKSHTLQPTALVHEAYLKLIDQTRVDWRGRTHFFAIGAQAMRRVLVDHARQHRAAKRGGGRQRITLDENLFAGSQREEDVLALEDALTKLAALDPRQARMVELRFFGGLTVDEVAEVLEMSKRSVEREWTMVRSWLRRELSADETS
jgi:RNA polymerase sigma factor (TIGR02999 family)